MKAIYTGALCTNARVEQHPEEPSLGTVVEVTDTNADSGDIAWELSLFRRGCLHPIWAVSASNDQEGFAPSCCFLPLGGDPDAKQTSYAFRGATEHTKKELVE